MDTAALEQQEGQQFLNLSSLQTSYWLTFAARIESAKQPNL
jgi:hypothetical protein